MKIIKKLILLPLCSVLLISCTVTVETPPPVHTVTPVQQDGKWAKKWWLPRHKQKLQEAKTKQVELIMLGDSITHGWENVGNKVWQQNFNDSNTLNLGFSGDRTEHVLWRLQNGAVDNVNPKLTVLMIGTNNTGQRMDPAAHTAQGIKAIVDELQKRLPESKLLLLAVFPRHLSPNNEMRKRNDEISLLAEKLADQQNIFFLNVNQAFLDEQGNLLPKLMPDLLHPNAKGYKLWADAMMPTIERLMK